MEARTNQKEESQHVGLVKLDFSLSPLQSFLKYFPQLYKLLPDTFKGHIYEPDWYLVSGVWIYPLDIMQF